MFDDNLFFGWAAAVRCARRRASETGVRQRVIRGPRHYFGFHMWKVEPW